MDKKNSHRGHRVENIDNKFPEIELTKEIISASMAVHTAPGPGLLESLYEEASAHEFGLRNIQYDRQKEIPIIYNGKTLGKHRLDLVVENKINDYVLCSLNLELSSLITGDCFVVHSSLLAKTVLECHCPNGTPLARMLVKQSLVDN